MNRKTTYLWYDLETFGTYNSYDRIAQIAWIRTDMDFKPIDQKVLYCKTPDYYLPNPEACLKNRLTPRVVNEKGISELCFAEAVRKEFCTPNTIIVGFNNIEFDDYFIRALFYRNLFNPYSHEWDNTRRDILNLIKAVHDLRPDGIFWPPADEEKGHQVFKLTEITRVNGIDQVGAHDAMVDIKATIKVAKLIKEKKPKLFDYYFKIRTKSELNKMLGGLNYDVFLLTGYFKNQFWNKSTHPMLQLKKDYDKKGNIKSILCYDLLFGVPKSLQDAKDNGALIRVDLGKVPFISPFNILNGEQFKDIGFTKEDILKTVASIKSSGVFNDATAIADATNFRINELDFDTPSELLTFRRTGFPRFQFYDDLEEWKLCVSQNQGVIESTIISEQPHYNDLRAMFIYNNYPDRISSRDSERVETVKYQMLHGINVNKEKVMTYESFASAFERALEAANEDDKIILEDLAPLYEKCKANMKSFETKL